MKWLTENAATVVSILSVLVAICTSAGWSRSSGVLKAVIRGVEDFSLQTGDRQVKKVISMQAGLRGVGASLHRVVKKVTAPAAILLAMALGATGCQAIHKGTEAVRGIGTAVFATTEIIDGAVDDVASVWDATGKKATDATGMTTPVSPPLPAVPEQP